MPMSYIYVLHFHAKLAHAGHYVGCTAAENLRARMTAHANGGGARIMEELQIQGLTWELGGLYSCSHAEMRRHERGLKNIHNSRRYCQLCHPHDQQKLPGCQQENIHNLKQKMTSAHLLKTHVDINTVAEVEQSDGEKAMAFILSLMKKDKDALGFVPIGGKTGIKWLLEKRQVILSYENGEPCGYAFYTTTPSGDQVNIHQCCTADDARLKGHAEQVVSFIGNKHKGKLIVAKVRDDLAANHFWQHMGFVIGQTVKHPTSGSTIHHYNATFNTWKEGDEK